MNSGNVYCGLTSQPFKKVMVMFSRQKRKKTILTVISVKFKSHSLSCYGGCVSANGMGNLHICEGTINAGGYIQGHLGATYSAI